MKRNVVSNPDPRSVTLDAEELRALHADELEDVGGGALPVYTTLKNPIIYGIPADFFFNSQIPTFGY